MTLLELLIAFTILAVIVVVLVASLRVGVRAWEAGERRAAAQQEVRAVIELVTEALSAAYPYRGRFGDGLERVVLFEGAPEELRFVTTAEPLLLDAAAAPFHAVTLWHTDDGTLQLVERLVPTDEPFGETPSVVLSRAVAGLKLEYRDDQGAWQSRWEKSKNAVPTAVRVELTMRQPGQAADRAAGFVVPLALGKGPA